jgi:hypothetical protein
MRSCPATTHGPMRPPSRVATPPRPTSSPSESRLRQEAGARRASPTHACARARRSSGSLSASAPTGRACRAVRADETSPARALALEGTPPPPPPAVGPLEGMRRAMRTLSFLMRVRETLSKRASLCASDCCTTCCGAHRPLGRYWTCYRIFVALAFTVGGTQTGARDSPGSHAVATGAGSLAYGFIHSCSRRGQRWAVALASRSRRNIQVRSPPLSPSWHTHANAPLRFGRPEQSHRPSGRPALATQLSHTVGHGVV